jgi:hypothetical protein
LGTRLHLRVSLRFSAAPASVPTGTHGAWGCAACTPSLGDTGDSSSRSRSSGGPSRAPLILGLRAPGRGLAGAGPGLRSEPLFAAPAPSARRHASRSAPGRAGATWPLAPQPPARPGHAHVTPTATPPRDSIALLPGSAPASQLTTPRPSLATPPCDLTPPLPSHAPRTTRPTLPGHAHCPAPLCERAACMCLAWQLLPLRPQNWGLLCPVTFTSTSLVLYAGTLWGD